MIHIVIQQRQKLTSCVAQLDCPPGNDFGGFTLDLEESHPTEVDEKGKPKKVKTQQHWVVGNRAQAYPKSVMMTDKADAKVTFFHILLMGVIATAPNLTRLSTGKNAKRRTLTIDLATLSILQMMTLSLPPAPKPAKVECFFVNFFSSDSDNLTGSILDALVQAEILQNDSSGYVIGSSGVFVKTRKKRGEEKPVGVLVRISPAEIQYLDLEIIDHNTQFVA